MTWQQWLIGLTGFFSIPLIIGLIMWYKQKRHKEKYKWEILCDTYYTSPPGR